MSISAKEREDRELAWKRAGKGNGLRWLILRDIVAGVAVTSMPLEKVQDFLLMLRGVSWSTSKTMLEELGRAEFIEGNIIEPRTKRDPTRIYYSATPRGVTIFLKSRKHIPVRLAQAALTTMSASGVVGPIRDSGEKVIPDEY